MSWKRLPMPDKPDADLNKKVRILVDESLGKAVADYLSESGYNAVYAGDVGLAGKSDEDLAAYAWRERRMLWTHDRDFLDDRIVPQHRNPGIVVLPGGRGDQQAMGTGLAIAVAVFGRGPQTWRKTKSIVGANGEMTIRHREFDSGKVTSSRYRMTPRGPEGWSED